MSYQHSQSSSVNDVSDCQPVDAPLTRQLLQPGSVSQPMANVAFSPMVPPASTSATQQNIVNVSTGYVIDQTGQVVFQQNPIYTTQQQSVPQFFVPQQTNAGQVITISQQQLYQMQQQGVVVTSQFQQPIPEHHVVEPVAEPMEVDGNDEEPQKKNLVLTSSLLHMLRKETKGVVMTEKVVGIINECVENRIKSLMTKAAKMMKHRTFSYTEANKKDSEEFPNEEKLFKMVDNPKLKLQFLEKYEMAKQKQEERKKNMLGKSKNADAIEREKRARQAQLTREANAAVVAALGKRKPANAVKNFKKFTLPPPKSVIILKDMTSVFDNDFHCNATWTFRRSTYGVPY